MLLLCVLVGLWDAGTKIYKMEGFGGLYRGFWVSSIQIVSGVMYIATYEGARHVLSHYNVPSSIKAMIGGGAASLVGQTVIVPFDVISQHLMVLGLSHCKGSTSKVSITIIVLKISILICLFV